MAIKNTTRLKVSVSVSIKSALLYGSVGIATGALCCFIVLFLNSFFRSDDSYAGVVNGTVSASQSICLGDSAILSANGGEIYRWTPSTGLNNPNIQNPKASPQKNTTYSVSVYKQLGNLINESGRFNISSDLLNGNDRVLFKKNISVEAGHEFYVGVQARTLSYLDKGVLDIRLNGKSIGELNLNNQYSSAFEFIWDNKKAEEADFSIYLKSYDGDGDIIEFSSIALRPLAKSIVSTFVSLNKDCKQCIPPQIVSTKVISENTVTINWNKQQKNKVVLRYKKAGEKNWSYLNSKSASCTIKDLDASFDYEVQVSTLCSKETQDSSEWSSVYLLKSDDRLIADLIQKNKKSYKGVLFPISVLTDSFNNVLNTNFDIDSPSDKVKLEVWNDKGQKFYSNYLPVENGKVDEKLRMTQALMTGKYMVRILDGDKTYNNQFIVQ